MLEMPRSRRAAGSAGRGQRRKCVASLGRLRGRRRLSLKASDREAHRLKLKEKSDDELVKMGILIWDDLTYQLDRVNPKLWHEWTDLIAEVGLREKPQLIDVMKMKVRMGRATH